MQAQRVSALPTALTPEVRDRIVLENLPLVRLIALRVRESLPVHVDVEDLIHAGVLGLIDAVAKYDGSKNVVFSSYAKHRIKGAILDSLRQLDWASRDLRKRQKQSDAAARELFTTLGRNPTEQEVAGKMGMDLDHWRDMVLQLRTITLASAPEKEAAPEYPAAPEMRPDSMCQRRQLRATLARAVGTLPVRYQKVVFLYYSRDMTMKEIGDSMGVNESRISQIHKTALRKMAVILQGEGICSAAAF